MNTSAESTAPAVDLTPCQSSQISAWGYHAPSRTLALKFASNGKVYHYADVPSDVAEGFAKAESIGKYFGAHVRGKFVHSVPAVETKGE